MDKNETMITNAPVPSNAEHTGNELDMLQKKLDDLVKETNQFTYIITHDLQAPLRMVTGFLELLEKKYADKMDAGAKQYIGYAVKGSVKMKELIFDLLDYSRLSSGSHEFSEVDLNEVLNEARKKIPSGMETKNIQFTHTPLPVVWGSSKLFVQFFSQLVDNAVKFNDNCSPEININANRSCNGWQISVTDNGIGIDPAHFEKIFVIFRKLHPDESAYKGTGTGLAICKKIAGLHNGSIEVSSQPGKGSTFTLNIPDKSI